MNLKSGTSRKLATDAHFFTWSPNSKILIVYGSTTGGMSSGSPRVNTLNLTNPTASVILLKDKSIIAVHYINTKEIAVLRRPSQKSWLLEISLAANVHRLMSTHNETKSSFPITFEGLRGRIPKDNESLERIRDLQISRNRTIYFLAGLKSYEAPHVRYEEKYYACTIRDELLCSPASEKELVNINSNIETDDFLYTVKGDTPETYKPHLNGKELSYPSGSQYAHAGRFSPLASRFMFFTDEKIGVIRTNDVSK